LPVKEIVIELNEDTTGMKRIGEEVTYQLELISAKRLIKRYIRPKYIKAEDEGSLTHQGITVDLSVFPIEKGITVPGLLAQIMIDKFVDHFSIYRQIELLKRGNNKISSSTINGGQEAIRNLLEPLYENLKHRVLSQGYLQVDENPIRVQDKSKKSKTNRGLITTNHLSASYSISTGW
jgi:transposase